MKVTRETEIGDISDWLEDTGLLLSVSVNPGARGAWTVILLGPRGGVRARGWSPQSLADAVSRAFTNYHAGVKP
jgi:hypothetical protein